MVRLQQILFGAQTFFWAWLFVVNAAPASLYWGQTCRIWFVVLSHMGSQPIVTNQGNTGRQVHWTIHSRKMVCWWCFRYCIRSSDDGVSWAVQSILMMVPLDQSLGFSAGDLVVWLCVRFLLLSRPWKRVKIIQLHTTSIKSQLTSKVQLAFRHFPKSLWLNFKPCQDY